MVGVPVIIRHKDFKNLVPKEINEMRVGVVSNVWFDEKDGWYWCDGVIWDETAQNLITDKGWSVSCSYDVKLADDAGGTENNIPYDIEFLDGVFTHLAIVDNPRYERANIVFNSKTVVKNATEDALGNLHSESNGQFVSKNNNKSFYNETTKTIELKGDELGFTDEEIRENGLKYFKENYQGKKFDNSELKGILFSNPGIKKFYTNSADIHKIKAIPALKDIIEKGKYQGSEDLSHPRQDGIIKFHRINHNVSIDGHKENMSVLIGEDKNGNKFYNLNHRTYTAENSSRGERAIGVANEEFSINIITDIQEDFNPSVQNIREYKLLQDLKKLVSSVENDKWITIHPNGEDNKGRPLLLKDGETPKEAIERTYGHPNKYIGKTFKSGNRELKVEKYDKNKNWYSVAVVGDENKKSTTHYYYSEKDLEKALEIDKKNKDFEEKMKESPQKSFDFSKEQLKVVQKLLEQMVKDENKTIKSRTNNNKEQDMALIEELKKLITKVENNKGEDMDDTKEKVDNEKVDKRKLIDEVAGIMKSAGADDEKIRTAIGKMEKLAYDKSEAGTADNEKEDDEPKDDEVKNKKVKNEETEEDEKKYYDLKKDVKEDVQNKCKNSVDNSKGGFFDKMNEIYNSAMQPKQENRYISREDRLKAGNNY